MLASIDGTQVDAQSGSAVAALVDFYRAFNARDLAQMAACWLQTDAASMSNPLGGVRRGWEEIGGVYEKIFTGNARVYVEFYDFTIYETNKMFCAVGRERGYVQTAQSRLDLAIRTTRVYHKQQSRWLQIHHHGSIEQADLLARYQQTVLQQTKS